MEHGFIGNNGLSNRHLLSLTGFRVLEAIKNLGNTPAVSVGGEKITKRHIKTFLSKNGFSVEDGHLNGELTALQTAFYVSHDQTTRSYSITDRGLYQIKENMQEHAPLQLKDSAPSSKP